MSHGRVVVTGASTGIGEATARRLVEEGYDVIAVARRAGRLRELSRQTGCQFFPADLTNQERIDELVAFLGKDGPIKALVRSCPLCLRSGGRGSAPKRCTPIRR